MSRTRFPDSDWLVMTNEQLAQRFGPFASRDLIINTSTGMLYKGPGRTLADCMPVGMLATAQSHGPLLYVSAQATGSGERGNPLRPYPTLAAAKDAAQAGDLVVVLPGTYDERNWLKDLVNWHLMPGASVTYTGSYDGPMLSDDAHGANGPVRCAITGYGRITNAGIPATDLHDAATLCVSHPQSRIALRTHSLLRDPMPGGNPNATALLVKGGNVMVRADAQVRSTSSDAVMMTGGEAYLQSPLFAGGDGEVPGNALEMTGGRCQLVSARCTAAGGESAVVCNGGNLLAHTDELEGGYSFEAGGGDLVLYNCRTASPGLVNSGTARLINCLLDTQANEYAAPLTVQGGGSAALVGCELIAHASMPSIAADSAAIVKALGSMANTDVHPNVTVLGHLLVAAAAAGNGDAATAGPRGTHSWQ